MCILGGEEPVTIETHATHVKKMTLTTNEYWMSYLRRQEAQEQRDLLHQQAMFESAREALEISETVSLT